MTGVDVALRPLRHDEGDFEAHVFASTRERELAALPLAAEQQAAFVAQQFAAQRRHYVAHYPGASWDVVLVDGRRAGRLVVHRGEGGILVVDIALLPEFRGNGVGTRLLHALLDEADAAGEPVTVHVERSNPALRLYGRLGFVPAEDLGVHLRLERPAGAVAPQLKTAS